MVLFTGNAGESASDTAGGSPEKPAHACHPKAGKRARYPVLSDYFAAVLREMQKHKKEDMEPTLWQEMTPDMRRLTKEEERRLFVQALCSLFSACLPGQVEEFGIYYDSFAKLLEKEQQTKKERGKVTAATTGMGLMLVLVLLL